MKELNSLDSKFLAVTAVKPESYSVLGFHAFRELRLLHIVNEVVLPLSRKNRAFQYSGELESLLWTKLVSIFNSLSNGEPLSRGTVLAEFADSATRYSLVSEVIALATSKPAIDAMASWYIKEVGEKKLSMTLNELGKGEAKPVELAQLVLDNILQSKNVSKTLQDLRFTEIDPTVTEQDFQTLYTNLMMTAGKGSGPLMPPSLARKKVALMQAIEFKLQEVAMTPQSEDGGTGAADWYNFAVAYSVYLYMSQPDIYASRYVASRTTDSKLQNQMIGQAAKKAAWLFSGLSCISEISDLTAALRLLDNVEDFLGDAFEKEISAYKDASVVRTKAREALKSFSLAPVEHHASEIIDSLTRMSGAQVILPPFIKRYFTKLPSAMKENEAITVPKGSALATPAAYSETRYPISQVSSFFIDYYNIVKDIRIAAETLSYSINSFLFTDQAFDPNALNIPSELFSVSQVPLSPDTLNYQDIHVRELIPYSIPRYKIVKKKPTWILADHVNSIISSVALVRSVQASRKSEPRLIWPEAIDEALPIGSTIASRFVVQPIPSNFVNYAVTQKTAPNLLSLLRLLSSSSNAALSHPQRFFEDWAESFLALNPSKNEFDGKLSPAQHQMLNAIAGIVRVKITATGGKKNYSSVIVPSVPVIFGWPTATFFGAQPSLTDYTKKDSPYPDAVLEHTVEDVVGSSPIKVEFYLHLRMPAKMMDTESAIVPWEFDLGAPIPIAIPKKLLSFFATPTNFSSTKFTLANDVKGIDANKPTMAANLALINLMTTDFLEDNKLIEKDQSAFVPLEGFSYIMSALPSLVYEVEQVMPTFSLSNTEFSEMVRNHLYRSVVPHTREVRVVAIAKRHHVLIEALDEYELHDDSQAPKISKHTETAPVAMPTTLAPAPSEFSPGGSSASATGDYANPAATPASRVQAAATATSDALLHAHSMSSGQDKVVIVSATKSTKAPNVSVIDGQSAVKVNPDNPEEPSTVVGEPTEADPIILGYREGDSIPDGYEEDGKGSIRIKPTK